MLFAQDIYSQQAGWTKAEIDVVTSQGNNCNNLGDTCQRLSIAQQANVSPPDTAHGIATLELVSQPGQTAKIFSEANDKFLPEVVPVRTVSHSDSPNHVRSSRLATNEARDEIRPGT